MDLSWMGFFFGENISKLTFKNSHTFPVHYLLKQLESEWSHIYSIALVIVSDKTSMRGKKAMD